DSGGTTRLIDFGLARPTGTPGASGTPGFASPEALHGEKLTPASDVYSSAAVLAMLLRGQPLFAGRTEEEVVAAQAAGGAPSVDGLDPHLREVLSRALAADPSERYPHANAFLVALDEAANRTYGIGWLPQAGIAALTGGAGSALITDFTLGPGGPGKS